MSTVAESFLPEAFFRRALEEAGLLGVPARRLSRAFEAAWRVEVVILSVSVESKAWLRRRVNLKGDKIFGYPGKA